MNTTKVIMVRLVMFSPLFKYLFMAASGAGPKLFAPVRRVPQFAESQGMCFLHCRSGHTQNGRNSFRGTGNAIIEAVQQSDYRRFLLF